MKNNSKVDMDTMHKITALKTENKRLTDKLYDADRQIAKLQTEIDRLIAENVALKAINKQLQGD